MMPQPSTAKSQGSKTGHPFWKRGRAHPLFPVNYSNPTVGMFELVYVKESSKLFPPSVFLCPVTLHEHQKVGQWLRCWTTDQKVVS